jgi:UPF0716 protein FxsA
MMFFKLFLIFAVIPMVELSLLIKIGSIIGTMNTIMIIILTAVIGAYMVRMEGIGVWFRIQKSLMEGIFPAEELIDGIMILIAGAVLLTPGLVTDILGFLMVFPLTRGFIKNILKKYFENRISHIHIQ